MLLGAYADLVIVLASILFFTPAPALTLEQLETLPPLEAAEAVLAEHQHGQITRLARDNSYGAAHGTTYFTIYEAPREVPDGCSQRIWKVFFSRPSNSDASPEAEVLYSVYEVGLRRMETCDAARYVHLNPGVDEDEALAFLRRIGTAATDADSLFDCASELDDELCRSPENIRQELQLLTPFVVSSEGGALALWLNTGSGSAVTIARFDSSRTGPLIVRRFIPPPF